MAHIVTTTWQTASERGEMLISLQSASLFPEKLSGQLSGCWQSQVFLNGSVYRLHGGADIYEDVYNKYFHQITRIPKQSKTRLAPEVGYLLSLLEKTNPLVL